MTLKPQKWGIETLPLYLYQVSCRNRRWIPLACSWERTALLGQRVPPRRNPTRACSCLSGVVTVSPPAWEGAKPGAKCQHSQAILFWQASHDWWPLFILPDTCSTERGVRNSTVGDASSISSVIHQWPNNYVQQLAAEQGPRGWKGKCAGLAEVSIDRGLKRRSYVVICIWAKESESLAHVMPQINWIKKQTRSYTTCTRLSNTLFSTGYSRLSIQLAELSLIILLQLSYSAPVKITFSIAPTLSDFFLIRCPPVFHLKSYAFQGKIIFCLLYSSKNPSPCLFLDLALLLLSHVII